MVKDRQWFKDMDKVKVKPTLGVSSYYGLYDPKKQLITIDVDRPVKGVTKTYLHELAHHIQYRHLKTFIRYKGIIHDRNFYTILSRLDLDCPLNAVLCNMEPYPECYQGWKWIKETSSYQRVVIRR